ncbi:MULTISPECIES: aminoacyl-tRNA hydrolase [Streptomyces]|jgi:PTH1 family peptidyl-tRNA hydrolase|uniref:Peptidyl-tRNA hydrolase n=2 Tax=Streptomyces griseoaurantiacus TaxID=68213 RepID=A0ABZ1V7W7_9ACTN|nr:MULTISPECIES: aminoacyl-tRNA hydrolase [Streptomyces]MBA5226149.1 aminoacyl-tRNA hydrolase [Streptomyces griseoaurantiacus]MDX3089018.1 aminoacyl-tRNA hydrolase [Streptomyces sp. ME12-02E]MDX3330392.1 aminoacyl-tRNA hydrolase [Streptomyces sp. ME02-6978a]MDX3360541.1 aminoacyl-tRNA hydrolase [Streptomyces sp. ME02-6978.2a]NJP69725.1 aminoacyl-tRNA hydrolase [Streptomyces sp. C1-2]
MDVTTDEAAAPWLVVGLGNPGPEYAMNRHNVGFMVADLLAGRTGGRFKRAARAQAQVVEGRMGPPGPGSRRVVLVKPMSYMNLSGGPVNALREFYKVPLSHVVAVHDELDIDYGVLRLKRGGGDNGHNGLKSMTKAMGAEYHRVRCGIGRPPGRMQVADFVLKDFSSAERKELDWFVDRAADAVECLVAEGLERAQNTYNS